MNRSHLIPILLLISVLTGCNFDTQSSTPTPEVIPVSPMPTMPQNTPQAGVPTPDLSSPEVAQVAVYTASPTPSPMPTMTPLPTETPGHWEYVVQPGDSLGYIIQLEPFNYDNYDVLREIVRINDNMNSPDDLPAPGNIILIPRPTATPTLDNTSAGIATETRRIDTRTLPENTVFGCHQVKAGETLISIVEQYGGLTLELLSQLNRDIDFRGCDFESPGGGPNCNPLIREGQCINVPFPTPTPTLSPTPSGEETLTPTPTLAAPMLLYPPQDSIAPPGIITLQWVSAGILQPEEYYLVQVTDVTGNTPPWNNVTRGTSIRLPDTLIPTDGETHTIQWIVFVVKANEQGLFIPVGGIGTPKTFQWQSR